MALYTNSYGITTPSGGVSLDNTRRVFNFGDDIAEINPASSPFFFFLNKLAKLPTNDPVFKMLERRHQWQRRYFQISGNPASVTVTGGAASINGVTVDCDYNVYGIVSSTLKYAPQFLVPGQVIAIRTAAYNPGTGAEAATIHAVVTAVSPGDGATAGTTTSIDLKVTHINGDPISATHNSDTIDLADNEECQVIGSAFGENTGAPEGWGDKMWTREGYTQIFKTAIQMFSGSAMATELRGIKNEFERQWAEKLLEHKMDIAHAMLFGVGSRADENGVDAKRFTHGLVPYITANGTYDASSFTYSGAGFDTFVDFLKDFLAPEDGVGTNNKLVLASRKIMAWLNKVNAGSFIDNSFSAGTAGVQAYAQVMPNMQDSLGFKLTRVSTVFGDLNFYNEVLLRNQWEDYMVIVDMSCLKYRPLVGNGISRDTFIQTNIQDNDTDGRKDLITTEAGLQIDLPEKCAVLKFS